MSLYKRKDSTCWWIKVTIDGKTIQRTSGTADKAQALELHDRLKVELWEQRKLGVKPRYSWKDAVVRWVDETSDKASHKDDLGKIRWLDRHLGPLKLDEITRDVIDQIRAAKVKEASKSTVNRYLALVRSILRRARDEWEWVDHIPKVRLFKEPKGRVRYLEQHEAENLILQLPVHQRDVVIFALATGLRQGNVVKLRWANVRMETRHLEFKASEIKNGVDLGIPLNETAMAILRRNIGSHPERVFTFRGRPFKNANTRAWRQALDRAGITDFRWHDLRHCWATWQRRLGTRPYELRLLGGWKSMAMVERYAHVSPDDLTEAASRLDSVLMRYDLATVAESLETAKLP
jgi:integrase